MGIFRSTLSYIPHSPRFTTGHLPIYSSTTIGAHFTLPFWDIFRLIQVRRCSGNGQVRRCRGNGQVRRCRGANVKQMSWGGGKGIGLLDRRSAENGKCRLSCPLGHVLCRHPRKHFGSHIRHCSLWSRRPEQESSAALDQMLQKSLPTSLALWQMS